MFSTKMTKIEKHAVLSLSSIMSLRMMGLFIVLPVFALHANQLPGATPFLIGLAMGIYGLSQAFLQIPFGCLSDIFGRKPIICIGFIIFIIGSLLAAYADSIFLLIIARSLQGAGAVGSTILALMADLTRENQRTKAMAIAGITIGFSFSIAMLAGPLLTSVIGIKGLFLLTCLFGIFAIFLLFYAVPTPQRLNWHRDTQPALSSFLELISKPELAKLNIGIFVLHAIFTASFITIPINLEQANLPASQQWLVYLPALSLAFLVSLTLIGIAEKKALIKPFFLASIFMLLFSEFFFLLLPFRNIFSIFTLGLFFIGFSLLEAFLPSLISRTAPAAHKGSALGIYSCAQFLGIFAGGLLGGLLYAKYSSTGVYLFCISLAFIWIVIAFSLHPPLQLINEILQVPKTVNWLTLGKQLKMIPGMIEVVFIAEEGFAYLKMEREAYKHPDFIKLKQQLYTAQAMFNTGTPATELSQ